MDNPTKITGWGLTHRNTMNITALKIAITFGLTLLTILTLTYTALVSTTIGLQVFTSGLIGIAIAWLLIYLIMPNDKKTIRFEGRWFWCELCNCPAIKCEKCGFSSCSGCGCPECHNDFEEVSKCSPKAPCPPRKDYRCAGHGPRWSVVENDNKKELPPSEKHPVTNI